MASPAPKELLTINLVDESRKKIPVTPDMLIKDLIEIIREKLGLREAECYAISEFVPDGSVFSRFTERFLKPYCTVAEEGLNRDSKLMFKIKLFKEPVQSDDSVAENLYFLQVKSNIVSSVYPCSERHAIRLASFEVQAQFSDYDPRKHKPGYLNKVGLNAYLPLSVSRHDYAYWQERLFALHARHKGMDSRMAKRAYVKLARVNPFFGMTFFDMQDDNSVLIKLAVAEDGVYFFFPDMKFRSSILFKDIASWSYTAEGLVITRRPTPGEADRYIFRATETQAFTILDLCNEYYGLLPEEERGPTPITGARIPDHLPLASLFRAPRRRQFGGTFSSRLELLKNQYMELCSRYDLFPIRKICQQIDASIDSDSIMETLDLSRLELGDRLLGIITNSVVRTMEFRPQDDEPWYEDVDLKNIDVSYNEVTQLGIVNLLPLIRHAPNLQRLSLNGNMIGNKGAVQLAPALTPCASLQAIELGSADVGNKGVEAILDACKDHPEFTFLNVQYNRISDRAAQEGIARALTANCKLATINLGSNDIDAKGVEALARCLGTNTNLTSLNLSCNVFGKNGATAIFNALRGNSTLQKLDISGNKLGSSLNSLISTVLSTSSLTSINLSGNALGVQANPSEFVGFLRSEGCKLQELLLDENSIDSAFGDSLAEALSVNRTITNLSLRDNALAARTGALPQPFITLLAAEREPKLARIDLSNNGVQPGGVSTLFSDAIERQAGNFLEELHLDGNRVERTVEVVAAFLRVNRGGLKTLSMNGCSLQDSGAYELAAAIESNTGLRAISLRDNNITLQGAEALAKALLKNSTLTKLDLSSNPIENKAAALDLFLEHSCLVPGKGLFM